LGSNTGSKSALSFAKKKQITKAVAQKVIEILNLLYVNLG
jgi:hypothetical protein